MFGEDEGGAHVSVVAQNPHIWPRLLLANLPREIHNIMLRRAAAQSARRAVGRPLRRRALRQMSGAPSSASTAGMRGGWARVALASLPIGGGLYVWQNWAELIGQVPGKGKTSSGTLEMDEMTRSQFERRYRLASSLGKGGFGEVWLATETSTGRKVAVKLLSMKQLPRALVEQEVTAMRRCGRHPNVVELIDAVWIAPNDANPCASHGTNRIHTHASRDTWIQRRRLIRTRATVSVCQSARRPSSWSSRLVAAFSSGSSKRVRAASRPLSPSRPRLATSSPTGAPLVGTVHIETNSRRPRREPTV